MQSLFICLLHACDRQVQVSAGIHLFHYFFFFRIICSETPLCFWKKFRRKRESICSKTIKLPWTFFLLLHWSLGHEITKQINTHQLLSLCNINNYVTKIIKHLMFRSRVAMNNWIMTTNLNREKSTSVNLVTSCHWLQWRKDFTQRPEVL